MRIGIIAPSPVPFCIGGAENVAWGLLSYLNQETAHQAELIKLPSREYSFWDLVDNYRQFSSLDVSHFDLVISSKYPAWIVSHPRHVVYMLHRLRGLYDTYHLYQLPSEPDCSNHEVASFVQFLAEHHGDPDRVPECFDRLDRLRHLRNISSDVFEFPGPLIRKTIHFLDDAALHPSRIARYAAIAENVRKRPGYFPPDVHVIVSYPPSHISRFENAGSHYFLTIGRLDAAKRVDLIVAAMLRARTDFHLKIAGTGPDEERLKKMARGDPRVEFLGFVNDSSLSRLYADALAVIYTPFDEDYGLVTIEAMASGKPVLTTLDAGGPNEFVKRGENGFSVAASAEELAEQIEYMASHVDEMRAMAPACQRQVGAISWGSVIDELIGSDDRRIVSTPPRLQRNLTLATTFGVYPPRGGGASRIYYLYERLAKQFGINVDLVTFTDHGQPAKDEYVARQVREIRIPKSLEHMQQEIHLSNGMDGLPIGDVVMPKLYSFSPQYVEALRRSASTSDFLVASHPYLLPALEHVRDGQPLIYEAHNVETRLKGDILPKNDLACYFLSLTEQLERRCWERASLIMTCSDDDALELTDRFGMPTGRTILVPNGVDVDSVSFTTFQRRKQLKQKREFGDTYSVLFMGSWHGPNIEAVLFVLEMAHELPHVQFHVLGSVGLYLEHYHFAVPRNVRVWGIVDDPTKNDVLSWVDLALNPMETGSGTNLKMLDYMAAGAPVLSTSFGARGLDLRDRVHIAIAPLVGFPQRIEEFRHSDEATLSSMTERARQHVVTGYSWDVIARRLGCALQELSSAGATPSNAKPRSASA